MTPPEVKIEGPRRWSRPVRLSETAETSPAQLKTFEELCRRSKEKQKKEDEDELEKDSGGDGNEEKQNRLRRSSSLKTGKTPPGTPGRKKIVRFADVMGLDLTEIRSFLDEIPNVPKSAYSDLDATVVSNGADELGFTSVVNPGEAIGTVGSASSFSAILPNVLAAHPPSFVLLPLFQQPGSVFNFLDRVRDHHVVLERAVERDMAIDGIVRVHNIAYHKSVFIRLVPHEFSIVYISNLKNLLYSTFKI